MTGLLRRLRRFLSGRRFNAAISRNAEAAEKLDAALNEVLKR